MISLALCMSPNHFFSFGLGADCRPTAEYIVVMTGREHRARFMGHDIYRAADFDILPLNPNITVQYPSHPVEEHLLALVRAHLSGGHFLFSYTYDLSRRLQAQWNEKESDATRPLWKQVCGICMVISILILSSFRQTIGSSGTSAYLIATVPSV